MSDKNKKYIRIRGANEHNLKNISLDIPRDELVVLTGLSGSGKSSLAFDTIYAEGQRRYMESLSSYARMFLGQMEKPDVESIEGLSPAISIDQKSTNRNPRSTVGTVTEIYDYFRLLYARIGIPHCPKCGKEIKKQTVDQMVDQIMEMEQGTRIQLLAPVVRGRKGTHVKLLERAKKSGYVRVRIDGSMYELSEDIQLDKNLKHNIEIVVDRLVVKPGIEKRLTDSVENVLHLAEGLMTVDVIGGEPVNFSQSFSCPDCGISIEEIEPRSFSFNNPFGACPECSGLGYKMEFDADLIIPDKSLSINEGAITVMGWQSASKKGSFTRAILEALAEEYQFSLDTPFEEYPEEIQNILIHGTNGKNVNVHYFGQRGEGFYDIAFEGIVKNVERRYRETYSEASKAEYEEFMRITPCRACKGQRLKPGALAVTIGNHNIAEITSFSIEELAKFLDNLELTSQQEAMLHIGVSSVPSLHLLPELLAAYHVQAPEVRFRTSCSDSLDVIRKVSEGGCDIGLAGTKTAAPGCGFLPVTSDELVLAAPNTPHFREYQQQKEPLRALLREPFLLREDNSGTKQETLYFLRNIGLSLDELNVIAVMDDAASLIRCITLGIRSAARSQEMTWADLS